MHRSAELFLPAMLCCYVGSCGCAKFSTYFLKRSWNINVYLSYPKLPFTPNVKSKKVLWLLNACIFYSLLNHINLVMIGRPWWISTQQLKIIIIHYTQNNNVNCSVNSSRKGECPRCLFGLLKYGLIIWSTILFLPNWVFSMKLESSSILIYSHSKTGLYKYNWIGRLLPKLRW
jgi:hypothetical protein